MFVYLAHNYATNETMEFTEKEYGKYLSEIQDGTIEIYETNEIEDD